MTDQNPAGFADADADDAYNIGDDEINYDNVAELAAQIDDINNIGDDLLRRAAADAWTAAAEGHA